MGILELAMFSLLDGTFTKNMESTPPRNVSICQSSYKQMTIGELIKPRVFEAIKNDNNWLAQFPPTNDHQATSICLPGSRCAKKPGCHRPWDRERWGKRSLTYTP